jgi:hypothetical protein
MIAIISHDAGGAEVLSSYVRQNGGDYGYVLDGPARKIFSRKLGNLAELSLEDALKRSASIFCGTSWQSDLEFEAIKQAHMQRKHSVTFLDHWVNYSERFTRFGETCLPDEIWVGDDYALSLASKVFKGTLVVRVDNPYLLDAKMELSGIKNQSLAESDLLSILYICEPVGEHAFLRYGDRRYWGYVEEDALRYFLSNISVLGKPIKRIVIRPHPSETQEKYRWVSSEFSLPIEFGGASTLFEEMANSNFIVGCESMAMVVALMAGKTVMSCIPQGGKPCSLPHDGIISLQNVLALKSMVFA